MRVWQLFPTERLSERRRYAAEQIQGFGQSTFYRFTAMCRLELHNNVVAATGLDYLRYYELNACRKGTAIQGQARCMLESTPAVSAVQMLSIHAKSTPLRT